MYSEAAADYGTKEDAFIYCAVNAHWENAVFDLPVIPEGMKWETVAYSGDKKITNNVIEGSVELTSRSMMVLLGHKISNKTRKGGKKNV